MRAIRTQDTFLTTPIPPCGGGGLSLWVNFRQYIKSDFTNCFKIFSSVNSRSLGRVQAVSTFFHKSNSFANQRLGSFRCNLFSNEKEQGVGAVQQKIGEETQGKTGATNE